MKRLTIALLLGMTGCAQLGQADPPGGANVFRQGQADYAQAEPAAEQRQQMLLARQKAQIEAAQRDEAALPRRAATIMRDASPALRRYLLDTKYFDLVSALATAANMCQLRSEQWMLALTIGLTREARQIAAGSGLDEADLAAGATVRHVRLHSTLAATSCQGMLNSPWLAELDRLEWQMTGGYH